MSDTTWVENYKNCDIYRLKKPQLQVMCQHYGLHTLGIKTELGKRIVNHRDSIYEYRPLTDDEIRQYLHRYKVYGINYHIRRSPYHIGRPPNIRFIRGLVRPNKIDLISKIELSVLCHRLSKIHDPLDQETLVNIYAKSKRDIIIYLKDIISKIDVGQAPVQAPVLAPVQAPIRQNTQIKNTTAQTIYIYWTFKRVDAPDYSDCAFLHTIEPGEQKGITYDSESTLIIASKSYAGERSYYMYVKDNIISEKKASEKDAANIMLIEMDRNELEQWREAALKSDYLLKQLKRLGIEKNENYAAIVDMHQDIVIPEHTERHKEIAGIPSVFTNVT